MSVWSVAASPQPPLWGAEGALILVSVAVEPPRLEALLDALARLEFPINPEIFHDAGTRDRPAARVEFPAYEKRLPEIRQALETCGFPAGPVVATAMLDSIHGKQAAAAAAGSTAN